ncbi:MAG: hypothetical protein WD552_00755 [Candidatus Paceibacterota bacterium]
MNDQLDNQASNNQPRSPKLLGVSQLQEKRQGKPQEDGPEPLPPEDSSRLFQAFLGLASITFVVLGIIALAAWGWTALNTEKTPPAPAIMPADFIYTETTREIQLATSTDVSFEIGLFQDILDVRPGGFTQFYFTTQQSGQLQLMTPQTFFARLTLNSDTMPVLDYTGNTFMYGSYAIGGEKKGSYVILPVADYENAYGALLQSEEDLSVALGPLGFPAATDFRDTVIENQDVRFATSTENTGIYWAFPQLDRLVITTDEATLRAVFSRLEQARRSQQ